MPMTFLKNERNRLAFRFGRASALRSTNDVIDQLQDQLDAERQQHAFDNAEHERQICRLDPGSGAICSGRDPGRAFSARTRSAATAGALSEASRRRSAAR